MTVEAIIKNVRWALDEEKGHEDFETKYMDNIIRSRIYDALRWVSLYADATLLTGGDSTESSATGGGCVVDGSTGMTYDSNTGVLTLPSGFVRLVRVKCSGWSKAVMNTIREDSEEYMMQNDNYPEAKATKERPVAALIESSPNKLQLFPKPSAIGAIDITYAVSVSEGTTALSASADSTTAVVIPDKVRTAFLYYLAYLVMVAYNENSKAQNMLAVAKMNAGVSDSKG